MGSIQETSPAPKNVLEYLRSRTQVDVDSLEFPVSDDFGPFVDCTSNQIEGYEEIKKPERAKLLKQSVTLARQLAAEYPNVTFEELAFEISMVNLSLSLVPKITGTILVMANPLYAYSTSKIVENAERLSQLCHRFDPEFDLSRLMIKVASTWEGLQACRKLSALGIRTLATTVFTIEQAILAAEAGCDSISPFVHEIKIYFDESYHDTDPILDLCVAAQHYYQKHSYPTRVKACSVISVEEVLQLAGVAAFTIPPDLLRDLAATKYSGEDMAAKSLFSRPAEKQAEPLSKQTFIDDEAGYRLAFTRRSQGKGYAGTIQALNIFCDFQLKGQALMAETSLQNGN